MLSCFRFCGLFSSPVVTPAAVIDENRVNETLLFINEELKVGNGLLTKFKKIITVLLEKQKLDLHDEVLEKRHLYLKLKNQHQSLISSKEGYTLAFQQAVESLSASVVAFKKTLEQDMAYYKDSYGIDASAIASPGNFHTSNNTLVIKVSIPARPKKWEISLIAEEKSEDLEEFSPSP
ncbi:MAG: hypothetical protein P4M14_00240 [Gammaproteobacteria bacterium]|nr:hypothetical protein [Gammaproteobacteria bacterium]